MVTYYKYNIQSIYAQMLFENTLFIELHTFIVLKAENVGTHLNHVTVQTTTKNYVRRNRSLNYICSAGTAKAFEI